jgi:hypothetical protein
MKLSKPARLLVAVAMLFSFKTIAVLYAGWLTVLAGIAAMPLVFAAAGSAMERPGLRAAIVAGAAGGLALHSGHPQLTYYTGLFVAVWAIGRIATLVTRHDFARARTLTMTLVGAGAIAFGLAAYLMIPLLHDVRLITRGAASYEFFTAGAPLPALGLTTIFGPERFGTPLTSDYNEFWEFVVYFGAVPAILAVFGLMDARRNPLVRAAAVGLALTLVMAIDTPLLKALYYAIPGYSFFRLPARLLFLSSFFAFCLAGAGLDRLLHATNRPRAKAVLASALIGLVAFEGSLWARRYLRTPDPIPYAVRGDYVGALVTDPARPSRVASMSSSLPAYGSAAALNVQLIVGYDPFNLRHYQAYMDVLRYGRAVGDRAAVLMDVDAIARFDLLDALNVDRVVTDRPFEAPAGELSLERVFDDQPQFRFYKGLTRGPAYVYKNQHAFARAFFAAGVIRADTPEEMTAAVLRTNVRDTAVVLRGDAGSSPASPGDRVDIRRWRAGELDLATHTAARRFLVISEVWHPGWRARVDGRAAALHRTDIALQGLWLEPGDHEIELRFWPVGLTPGLIVTGVTVCAVLGLTILAVRRRRER